MSCCVKVAVDNAAISFDKLYTYLVPDSLAGLAKMGARVAVPFGSGKPRAGVILGFDEDAGSEGLKAVLDVERGEPLLDDKLVQLIFYLKERTLCTYYDAVKVVLPKNSRASLGEREGRTALFAASKAHTEAAFRSAELSAEPRLTEKQRAVYELLKEKTLSYSEIREAVGISREVVNRLADKGIIERVRRDKSVALYENYLPSERAVELSPAQKKALDGVWGYVKNEKSADTTLLHGVTSSGKTLIYAALAKRTADEGKGVLLLVPEIALATQTIYRFKELFGEKVGVLHSKLSDTERQLQWQSIRSGEIKLVIGTRSAVFAPIRDLGLIIIDEEQENSYWSEQSPRYGAADVAAFRVKQTGAHLLLSSATPSVESYYKAMNGAYNFVELKERYMDMPLPKVRVVDKRAELISGNAFSVSEYLKDKIDKRLERGEQCLLLLNRRGYHTVSMCTECRELVKCEHCDTTLVYHKDKDAFVCHYCGAAKPFQKMCPKCGGAVRQTGTGTERIEEELGLLFPKARITRFDLDSVSRKNSAEELLLEFSRGKYDIIIGTQMIAKGLDFRNVTLAGVLSIDQLLLMPSFRANERTFAMLTQVIGRSGRGDKEGEAVIQTIDPENPVIRLAARQDYAAFYEDEIVMRKLHLYPPFCSICTVGFVSESDDDAKKASEAVSGIIARLARTKFTDIPLRLLGPVPMRISYVNELYRRKLTIKSRGDRRFRDLLREAFSEFDALPLSKKARYFADFGPDSEN